MSNEKMYREKAAFAIDAASKGEQRETMVVLDALWSIAAELAKANVGIKILAKVAARDTANMDVYSDEV